jgi:hypothetical protein
MMVSVSWVHFDVGSLILGVFLGAVGMLAFATYIASRARAANK